MNWIDSHVYCLPPRLADPCVHLPQSEEKILKAIHSHPEGPMALALCSPQRILQSMAEAKISHSVLIAFPWNSLSLCRETNDFLISTRQQYPTQFSVVGSIHPKDSKSLEECDRLLSVGCIGLKMNAEWQNFEFHEPLLDEISKKLAHRKEYILIHVDQVFKRSAAPASSILEFTAKHPKTKFVFAHMGGMLGLYSQLDFLKDRFSNLWFDTAISETVEMIEFYVRVGLKDRILFGSDYPFNACHSQKDVVDRIEKLALDKDVLKKVSANNFENFLKVSL
jgi:predicted TIM-barrel fold metal-dependent hydrolase